MSLTKEQLDRTLKHIRYPRSRHAADPLRRLQQLMLRHVAWVPFENVGIHYNPTHQLSLALDDLFDKIVVRSKGGYCVELNAFFAAILRGLGYQVLTVGGRVRAGNATYTGWSHMCLIVTIDGKKFVADVGFGADAPMQPIPLIDGTEFEVLDPRRGRLEYRSIDQHTDPTQRLWVYSTCDSAYDDPDDPTMAPWVEQYCFVEIEHFAADYNQMNYYTSTNPASFFMPNLLAVRAVLEPDGDAWMDDGSLNPDDDFVRCEVRFAGVLTYFREEVRFRAKGLLEKKVLEKVTTEAERIAALQRYFDIPLTKEDQESIYATGLALDKKPE